jgi:hypothetical protein
MKFNEFHGAFHKILDIIIIILCIVYVKAFDQVNSRLFINNIKIISKAGPNFFPRYC